MVSTHNVLCHVSGPHTIRTCSTENPSAVTLAVRSLHDVKHFHVDHVLGLELLSFIDHFIKQLLTNLCLKANSSMLSWPRISVELSFISRVSPEFSLTDLIARSSVEIQNCLGSSPSENGTVGLLAARRLLTFCGNVLSGVVLIVVVIIASV